MFVLRIATAGVLAVTTAMGTGVVTSSAAQARSRPILAECGNPHTGALVGSSVCNCRLGWNAIQHRYWIRHSAAFCSNFRSQNTASLGPNKELGRKPGTGGSFGGSGGLGGNGGGGPGENGGGGPGGNGGGGVTDNGGGAGPGGSDQAGNPGNDKMVGNAGENPNGKFSGDNPGQGNSGNNHTH